MLTSEESKAYKEHSSHASYIRSPGMRRLTKGSLNFDDPLAAQGSQAPEGVTAEAPGPLSLLSSDPISLKPLRTTPQMLLKDFSYLRRPDIYHSLTQPDIIPAFRTPPHQSTSSTPSSTLVTSSNFRSAAIAAACQLCTSPNLSASEIFSLLYTRLTCLILINATPFAAEESKALEDLNSPFYRDPITQEHLLPWELRVIAVRLQGIGYGDPRRGFSGYYDMARDARKQIIQTSGKARHIWEEKLEDLGLRIGNALVEMGDLMGAVRHFSSLRRQDNTVDKPLNERLALLCLRLGDVVTATMYIQAGEDGNGNATALRPLLSMAEGRYEAAVGEWKVLLKTSNSEQMTQNLAVCLLYTGHMEETIPLLTSLINAGHSFHALTFNLSTMYELCTEKSHAKKIKLAEEVARIMAIGGGWGERVNADFKL